MDWFGNEPEKEAAQPSAAPFWETLSPSAPEALAPQGAPQSFADLAERVSRGVAVPGGVQPQHPEGVGVHGAHERLAPRALALSANQINQLVNTGLASTLAAGSVVVFYNAYDIESLPISLFAISIAVASFPVLGTYFVQKKLKAFLSTVRASITHILFIMVPLSVFMYVLRAQIVRLILGYGKYNWEDTIRPLDVFGVFVCSLVFQALIPIFARAFYARENTKLPVLVSVVSIAVNIMLAVMLTEHYGIIGLALAFSGAAAFQCIALWLLLEQRVGRLLNRALAVSVVRIVVAGILGGGAVYISLYLIAAGIGTERVWTLFVQGLVSFLAGSGVYMLALWIMGEQLVKVYMGRVRGLLSSLSIK